MMKRNNKIHDCTVDKLTYAVNYFLLALFLIIVLYPFVYIISCSFSSGQALISGKVTLFPVDPTLDGYRAILEYRDIWTGFANSFLYTISGTLIGLVLTILAAYPLSRSSLVGCKPIMMLFLFTMLLQTVVFGHLRVWGVKLSLLPVAVVCIAMHTGHEGGGLFGLLAALVWQFTGADDGSLALISFTLCGILAGWLCDSVCARRAAVALGLSLAALVLHEGAAFLMKFYLESADFSLIRWVPLTALLSVLACPVLYPLAKAIGKVGGC